MINYKKLIGLLSMVFEYDEVENVGNIMENYEMYPLCDVDRTDLDLILKKVKNKITFVRQTIRTLEYTSETMDLDIDNSIDTLIELLNILSYVKGRIQEVINEYEYDTED